MTKITTVRVGEHFDNFVDDLIKGGRYASTSEVLRSALRLLEVHEASVQQLNISIMQGINSGVSSLTLDEIINQINRDPKNDIQTI